MRTPFRLLFRHFFLRFLDNELLSPGAEIQKTLVQIIALLASLGLVTSLGVAGAQFRLQGMPYEVRRVGAWTGQELFLSFTITAVGLMTVFLWDVLFPDRRDCMILSALPLPSRTIFAAKTASMLAVLGLLVLALNLFAGLLIPMTLAPPGSGFFGLLRSYLGWWTATALAGVFMFFALLGLQGALIQLLGHSRYRRVSGHVQLLTFFLVLAGFFLFPAVAKPKLLASDSLLPFVLPWVWFLGLQQALMGVGDPLFHKLALRAVAGLAAASAVVAITYAAGYARHVRRVIEQADLTSERFSVPLISLSGAMARLMKRPVERSLFRFITRTIARSRQHRLVVALYGGVGLAYVFDNLERARMSGPEGLAPPLILVFFTLVGLRAAFSLPMELGANWIFRLTERDDPIEYVAAVHEALLVLGVAPVCALSFFVYTPLLGWWQALRFVVFLFLVGLVMIEILLARFEKIPFTCSYLPGKANLKVMFGVYWTVFMVASFFVTNLAYTTLRSLPHFVAATGIMAGAAWFGSRRRRRRFRFVFLERQKPPFLVLDLAAPPEQ
ncbi:MAG: hypothetical protein ACRD44_16570 [Bryobacteraceae bacterium]